jgi:hypothetical protein
VKVLPLSTCEERLKSSRVGELGRRRAADAAMYTLIAGRPMSACPPEAAWKRTCQEVREGPMLLKKSLVVIGES